MIVIVMGVEGCGKTTIGQLLAKQMGWNFYDGDDYHPKTNIEKMSHNIPLTDEDRSSWLAALHKLISGLLEQGQSGVLACSALKRSYREELGADRKDVHMVYLKGSFELIKQRVLARQEHFMKASMLPSQFGTLEEPSPDEALIVDITPTPEEIVREIETRLGLRPELGG